MQMQTVKVENPQSVNLIMGRISFSRTIDDIQQVLIKNLPGTRFGIAHSADSGAIGTRSLGTDDSLIELAKRNADNICAMDTFFLFIDQAGPVRVLKALKHVRDIVKIYCATNSEIEVIVTAAGSTRGILGLLGEYKDSNESKIQMIKKETGFLNRFFH